MPLLNVRPEVPHVKLSGVKTKCRNCGRTHPIKFIDDLVPCPCGMKVELPTEFKQHYSDKFASKGHA